MLFIDLFLKVLAHNGGALWFHPQPQEVSPTSIPSKSLLGRFRRYEQENRNSFENLKTLRPL